MDRLTKEERPTIIEGEFNTLLLVHDRTCRLKISGGIEHLNTINKLDLIDIYKMLCPTTTEYTFL